MLVNYPSRKPKPAYVSAHVGNFKEARAARTVMQQRLLV